METVTNVQKKLTWKIQRAQIIFWPRKSESDPENKAKLYVSIGMKHARVAIPTGITIAPKDWEKGKIIGTTEELLNIDQELKTIKLKLQEIETELRLQGKTVSPQRIKQTYYSQNFNTPVFCPSFLNVFRAFLEKKKELIGIEIKDRAYIKYEASYKRVKEFIKYSYKRSDLELDEIRPKFGLDFYHFLRTIRNCGEGYSSKLATILKAVMDYAIIEEHIQYNLLKPLKFKKGKAKEIVFLTVEQLKILINTQFPSTAQNITRDCFLFQCYTGLAYIDLVAFSSEHIKIDANGRSWIMINRAKTGTKSIIPLLPEAHNIIIKYAELDKSTFDNVSQRGLLPVYSNQAMNRLLKEIGLIVGINPEIMSTHTARKTFATTVLNTAGVSIETVSAMLGHSSTKITQSHYAKVNQNKISSEMEGFKFLT